MLDVMSLHNDYLFLELHKARLRDLQAEARRRSANKIKKGWRRGAPQRVSNSPAPASEAGRALDENALTAVRLPEQWNVSAAEVAASYPCERLVDGPVRALTRGVDIDAPVAVVFRWLCQLRVAPYSYDWIDNRGRRSPRTLTPGLERLARGQQFLIAEITDFELDRHITGRATAGPERLFGVAASTYQVLPQSSGSRLLVRLLVHEPQNWRQQLRFRLLAWSDLIMMRKQLLTLKALAEHTASAATAEEVAHVGARVGGPDAVTDRSQVRDVRLVPPDRARLPRSRSSV